MLERLPVVNVLLALSISLPSAAVLFCRPILDVHARSPRVPIINVRVESDGVHLQ